MKENEERYIQVPISTLEKYADNIIYPNTIITKVHNAQSAKQSTVILDKIEFLLVRNAIHKIRNAQTDINYTKTVYIMLFGEDK